MGSETDVRIPASVWNPGVGPGIPGEFRAQLSSYRDHATLRLGGFADGPCRRRPHAACGVAQPLPGARRHCPRCHARQAGADQPQGRLRDQADRARAIPHLLVDRFRFDSFTAAKVGPVVHDTYARYVDGRYMYFIVTPPEETVERGWPRWRRG